MLTANSNDIPKRNQSEARILLISFFVNLYNLDILSLFFKIKVSLHLSQPGHLGHGPKLNPVQMLSIQICPKIKIQIVSKPRSLNIIFFFILTVQQGVGLGLENYHNQ